MALIAAIIVVAGVGAALIINQSSDRARLAQSRSTPAQPRQDPPSQPSPSPESATPTPIRSPGQPDPEDLLSRNPLLSQTMPTVPCAVSMKLPSDPRTYQAYFAKLVACAQNSYRGPVTKAGFELPPPVLLIFSGTLSTPCGTAGATLPAFYCPPNQTIYLYAGFFTNRVLSFRLGTYYLAFHEYAHHIQRRVMTFEAGYGQGGDQMQTSRRIELEADCFSAIQIATLTPFTDADWVELKSWRQYASDETHGQTESQLFWLDRGFKTDAFAMCNTWAATEHVG